MQNKIPGQITAVCTIHHCDLSGNLTKTLFSPNGRNAAAVQLPPSLDFFRNLDGVQPFTAIKRLIK